MPPLVYQLTPLHAVAFVLIGLFVGVMSGLFGIGGGFVIVPVLTAIFGVPYTSAVASCLASIVGTNSSGLHKHYKLGNVRWHLLMVVCFTGSIGSYMGVWYHKSLRHYMTEVYSIEAFDLSLNSIYGVFLLASALLLVWHTTVRTKNLAAEPDKDEWHLPFNRLMVLGVSGVGVGFLGGMLGVGGGLFLMPLLVVYAGAPAQIAVATCLGVGVCSSLVATIGYAVDGAVNFPVALTLIVGSLGGARLGASIGNKMPTSRFQKWFVTLIFGMIAMLAVRSAGLWMLVPWK